MLKAGLAAVKSSLKSRNAHPIAYKDHAGMANNGLMCLLRHKPMCKMKMRLDVKWGVMGKGPEKLSEK